jgi:hypothetical protein
MAPRLSRISVGNEMGIKTIEQPLPARGVRIPKTESSNRGFLEEIVTEKKLVGPVARYNDIDTRRPREFREVVHLHRARAKERHLCVPQNFRQAPRDCSRTYRCRRMHAANFRSQLALTYPEIRGWIVIGD